MTKLHLKSAATRAKDNNLGTVESYNTDVNLNVTYNIVAGGTETIAAAPTDRLMIITQGFANTKEKNREIRDGSIIEIKAGEEFAYQGQLKYFLVEAK
ncbi:hypothetical protein [Bacillus toyonensis]|uniref:hypothetical protein n=1 Tax=Bacillus toyonensis TaxID=155322 RepID=UPI002E1E5D52|nr:hypothetical protein [Bacillus toyonensis]